MEPEWVDYNGHMTEAAYVAGEVVVREGEPGEELLRRTASVLSMHLQDEASAADCYAQLLGIDERDEEALRAVLASAEQRGDTDAQAKHLEKLSVVIEDKDDKRTLLFDLAELQRDGLDKPESAIATLRTIVEVLDAEFEPALTMLVELCEQVGDHAGLAAALEPGSYTKEPAKTQFGWHVINLQDKRQSRMPDFETIKSRLTNIVRNKRLHELVDGLRENAEIEIKASSG